MNQSSQRQYILEKSTSIHFSTSNTLLYRIPTSVNPTPTYSTASYKSLQRIDFRANRERPRNVAVDLSDPEVDGRVMGVLEECSPAPHNA